MSKIVLANGKAPQIGYVDPIMFHPDETYEPDAQKDLTPGTAKASGVKKRENAVRVAALKARAHCISSEKKTAGDFKQQDDAADVEEPHQVPPKEHEDDQQRDETADQPRTVVRQVRKIDPERVGEIVDDLSPKTENLGFKETQNIVERSRRIHKEGEGDWSEPLLSSAVSDQIPIAWVFHRRKRGPRQWEGMSYKFHPDETSRQLPEHHSPVKMFHQDETLSPFQTAKKRESPKRTPN